MAILSRVFAMKGIVRNALIDAVNSLGRVEQLLNNPSIPGNCEENMRQFFRRIGSQEDIFEPKDNCDYVFDLDFSYDNIRGIDIFDDLKYRIGRNSLFLKLTCPIWQNKISWGGKKSTNHYKAMAVRLASDAFTGYLAEIVQERYIGGKMGTGYWGDIAIGKCLIIEALESCEKYHNAVRAGGNSVEAKMLCDIQKKHYLSCIFNLLHIIRLHRMYLIERLTSFGGLNVLYMCLFGIWKEVWLKTCDARLNYSR
jgi:hypothetical protein